MASLPLNNFKTVPLVVDNTEQIIYTAPLGITAIVLMAQAANITSTTKLVSFYHNREDTNLGTISTELVIDYPVPKSDTLSLLSGKLVLESGDSISISSNSSSGIKFICSILETSVE